MVGHKVKLEGAALPGITDPQGRPTIVSIPEQDFIRWFLDRMESDAGQQELADRNALKRTNDDGQVRLFQPVHRSFNLILVEAFCEVEGLPRVDPKKILKAGATIRRLVKPDVDKDGEEDEVAPKDLAKLAKPYGWVKSGGKILGWRALPDDAIRTSAKWDPDPTVRREVAEGKNKVILKNAAALATEKADYDEAFARLYPAPTKLCEKLGKTLLYGYLPLTSSERSEDDPPPETPFTEELVTERLPVFLWHKNRLQDAVDAGDVTAPLADDEVFPSEAVTPTDALATVIAGVSYLAQEPGLFTPPPGDEDPTKDLRDLLLAHKVEVHGRSGTRSLYTVLEQAYDLLVRRANDDGTTPREVDPPLRLPVEWPEFEPAEQAQFVAAIQTAMAARWARLSPGETRFQDLAARYEIQAFARIDRSDCGCPPETVWTPETAPTEIIPWYEGGEAPPTIVELPAPTEDFFSKLKPNVAFKVPEEIQQFMSALKLDKLMDGEKPEHKMGWGMICGFSIPITTICAFIVLQIFLVLFHILFWWLPFIRICIPFPKSK
jgi:hypothetical protein